MPAETAGVWLLMAETGVRVSDAVCAKNGDFDAQGFFHWVAHKTGKRGRARVSDEFLRRYVDSDNPDMLLFPSPRRVTRPVRRETVFRHIKRAAYLCGIDPAGIGTHTARKSYAVRKYAEDGLGATMAALQHRDAATTLLYALDDDPVPAIWRAIRDIQRQLEDVSHLLDSLCDRVFGDDTYSITAEGQVVKNGDFSETTRENRGKRRKNAKNRA